MSGPSDERERGGEREPGDEASGSRSPETLRKRVEEEYDFDDFGPSDMRRMSADEWEAAFDHDSWVTGPELLDRVEADLRARVARRDVFAVVERETAADGERIVAYSDEGYALVYGDGSVEGRGTVLRDVKPSVALCSMPDYEVPDPPDDAGLPEPDEVPRGDGTLGNLVLQAVAVIQLVAGVALLVAWLVVPLNVIAVVAAAGFLIVGVFLLVVVANARLSDRFRAEEYRERLRSVGVETGERPAFVPDPDDPATAELDGPGSDGAADGGDDRTPGHGGRPGSDE